MGIDVYLEWDTQTESESKAQFTGFDTTKGNVGYLREAYHGGPYVTKFLFKEAWYNEEGICRITAMELKLRLPRAKRLAFQRAEEVYGQSEKEATEQVKAFEDFVNMFEQKEMQGLNPYVYVSY
jgi:hypothetical protein